MSKLIARLAAPVALLALAAPANADTVTDWNLNAANALIVTAAQPPQQSVPHMAMVHGAVYDAVNAIDGGHEGYLMSSRAARPGDSKDAAAATRRLPRPRAPRPRAAGGARCPVRRVARPDRGRSVEATRDRRRRRRSGDDDRGADRRRPLRRLPVHDRLRPWRVEADAARVRQRSQRVAEGRHAVPDPQRVAVRLRRAGPAHEPPVRARVQRGEGDRLGHEHHSDGRSDGRRPLLGGEPAGHLEPHHPHALGPAGGGPGRQRAPVRGGLPDRRGRGHHRLERQGALLELAADHRDPRGEHGREPADRGRPRLAPAERHAAVPGALVRAQRVQRLGRRDVAGVLRDRPARRGPTPTWPASRDATRGSRTRSTRSSRSASGPASTSGRRTCRPGASASRSHAGASGTTSSATKHW